MVWNRESILDNVTFLSDFVGGLWQGCNPTNHPLVWWTSLGGVVLWGMIGGISAIILRRLFHCSLWTSVLLTMAGFLMFSVCNQDFIIHYYTFPALLMTCYFLILLIIQQGNKGWAAVAGLGVLNALLIFARMSLIYMLGAPILLWLVYLFLCESSQEKIKIRFDVILKWTVGFCLGVAVIFILRQFWLLPTEKSFSLSAGVMPVMVVLYIFLKGWWQRLGLGLLMLWSGMACVLLAKKYPRLKYLPMILFLIGICVFLLVAVSVGFNATAIHLPSQLPLVCVPFMLLCLMIHKGKEVSENCPNISPQMRAWLITICLATTGFPVGSDANSGISRTIYLCPVMAAIMFRLLFEYSKINPQNRWSLSGFGLLALALVTPFCNVMDDTKFRCTAFSSLPELKWMASTPQRMAEIEENYRRIREFVKPNDEIFYVGRDHLWVYILNVKTPGIHPRTVNSDGRDRVAYSQMIAKYREDTGTFPLYAMSDVAITGASDKFHAGDFWTYRNVITQKYKEVFRHGSVIFWRLKRQEDQSELPDIVPTEYETQNGEE